jgi:hypothetical protein
MNANLTTIETTVEWLIREDTRMYMERIADKEKRYKLFTLKWTNHRPVRVFVDKGNKILT